MELTSTWNPHTLCTYGKLKAETYPKIASGLQHGSHKITTSSKTHMVLFYIGGYYSCYLYDLLSFWQRQLWNIKTHFALFLAHYDARGDCVKIRPLPRQFWVDRKTTVRNRPHKTSRGRRSSPTPNPVRQNSARFHGASSLFNRFFPHSIML